MGDVGRRSERGVAAVEFALVVPILLLLIFGIVEYGYRYQQVAVMNSAAFTAARDMSINGNVAQATTAARGAGAPSTATVSVSPASCSAGANVTVTVTATKSSVTKAFGANFTVVGKSVARCTN